jgi:hypothetical protein
MRSPPDARRRRLESACRLGVFALLGWMLGTAFFPTAELHRRTAAATELARALPVWTTAPRTDLLELTLDRAPSRAQLAWLSALRRAGHSVAWSGSVPAAALAVEPAPEPGGALRFSVAAPDSTPLRLHDALGDLDSLITTGRGAALVVPRGDGDAAVIVGPQSLAPTRLDSASLRPLLIVGAAGWETKFTAASFEESGWAAETRMTVAPGVTVGSAAALALDTAHFSAVVALDTTVKALGAGVATFVRSGGGLLLAGDAWRASNVAALAPGRTGPRVPATTTVADTLGLASAGYLPITQLRADADVVERRGQDVSIAARRVGAGRVVQVGYDETWRWRMSGGPQSVRGHRAWWSRLASAVAYARFSDASPLGQREFVAVPRAALMDALGAAREPAVLPRRWSVDQRWLLAAIFMLLLVEWGSRRTRGSR